MVEATFLHASGAADIIDADLCITIRPDECMRGIDQLTLGIASGFCYGAVRFHVVQYALDRPVKSTLD